MLSYGRYHTYQSSSNITYASQFDAQRFLTYSPNDNILIFIEQKHQVHVFDVKSHKPMVTIPMDNILISLSAPSIFLRDRHELYFLYESLGNSRFVELSFCNVHFNFVQLIFENRTCTQSLKIPYKTSSFVVYGIAIHRDTIQSKISILFISSNIGLIYTVFDLHTSKLIRSPIIMRETSTVGNVVVAKSGNIYLADKQGNTIYQMMITRNFRLRYGKVIKSNAIKDPFSLITDECNQM